MSKSNPLPYENTSSGKNALLEIDKILRAFGCTSFGSMEKFDTGTIVVQFEYRGRKISVEASAKGYAAAWLRRNPYHSRRAVSKDQYEQKALQIGSTAVYSILRDWIKGQVTAVECGVLSFEGAFLGQILLPSGQTVMQHIEQQNLLEGPK